MVGNLVSGKRIAQASGRDLGQTDDNDQVAPQHTEACFMVLTKLCRGVTALPLPVFQFLFLSEVLQWRAQTTPDHVLYTLLSSRVTSPASAR